MVRYLLGVSFVVLIVGIIYNKTRLAKSIKDTLQGWKPVHWAWLVIFVAIINFGKIESDNLALSNGIQLVLVPLAGSILLASFFGRVHSLGRIKFGLICLLLYAVFGVISGIYSPYPAFSIYKGSFMILPALAVLLAVSYEPEYFFVKKFIAIQYLFFVVLLLSFIIGGLIDPERAFSYKEDMLLKMLHGWIIKTNPNSLGFIAGIITLVGLNRLIAQREVKSKFFYFSLFITSLTVSILAQSRAVIAGIIACTFFCLMCHKRFLSICLLIVAGALIFVSQNLSCVNENIVKYYNRGQSAKQLDTWSGRLPAWKYSWKEFKKSPVLGYGMAAGVRFQEGRASSFGNHLHSSYFEVLVNSGLIGFVPWALCLLWVLKTITATFFFPPAWFKEKEKKMHIEIATLVLFSTIRSISGTTFVYVDHSFMLYSVIISYCIIAATKQKRSVALANPA